MSDVSGEQVEALAGGPFLQQLILNQERNARQVTPKMLARATQRLASALQQVCLSTSQVVPKKQWGCPCCLRHAC